MPEISLQIFCDESVSIRRQYAISVSFVIAILFMLASPAVAGMGRYCPNESESPIESEEEPQEKSEEVWVTGRRLIRLKPANRHTRQSLPSIGAFQSAGQGHAVRFVEKHRLAAGVLAPLTC